MPKLKQKTHTKKVTKIATVKNATTPKEVVEVPSVVEDYIPDTDLQLVAESEEDEELQLFPDELG